MKTVRSLLALSLSAALILLSPGSRAWAQAAEAATGAAAPSAGIGALGGVHALPSTVGLTALSAPAPIPGLSAPSASLSAPALSGAPAAVSAAAAPTTAAAAPAASAASAALSFDAAPAAEPASAAAIAIPAPAPASTPAVSARPPSATSALNQASRALAASSAFGSRSLALDRLFFGARRVLGLDSAPAVDASAPGAANASGLLPATGRAAAPAPIPAPRAASLSEIAPAAAHAVALGASILHPLVGLATVMVSMVLHEIGHAKVAAALGDPTARLEGRASFNPLKWGRHVDPIMTIALPLATFLLGGFIFGGAKPVPVDSSYFKNPVRDMAKVAFAGPAVNLALAGAGALAYAGAVALGMGGVVLGALTTFIFINSLLALFNLIPMRPLDGGHILAALLPAAASARLDAFYARFGALGMLPVMAIALLGGGVIVAAATALTHLLIGVSIAATGVQVASAALPAIAALGMALGTVGTPPTALTPAAAAPRPGTETVVVMFDRTKSAAVTKDLHLAALDARRSDYALTYQRQYGALMADVSALGVTPQTLAAYNASPVASYRRINAATFTLDAGKAEEFAAMLRAQGHRVYPNERRKIILPVPFHPEASDPASRNAISMAENLKITRADAVQAIARGLWGAPNMDPGASSGLRRLFAGAQPAQPKVGVVDSGADTSHPLLKRVKQVQNFTTEPNTDDIGHGSWVTSMVLNYAPWLANLTHYKTFTNGGATLDDILKALTAAANDGNLVISNSWGSDDGDSESPDSKLVQQLAQEGHIMVFAGGNAGPGANTIGSPAIIQFKDPTTGAIRVVAVAATDRNKKVASFSSVGPGSPKTVGRTGFAHRPDLASDGVNTEGAWPQALGDADRTDPDAGPLKAISGTSMSTPTVAGAIVLLAMLFGVTEIGPKLDAIVVALLSTLQKTGKNDADHEGGGFMDVKAAYDALVRQFGAPSAPGFTARLLGLAPAPSYVDEYRALSRQVRDDAASEAAFRRDLNESGNSADVREELLAHLENYILPEHAARRERLAALIAAHPDAAYAAAGPLGRAWLRLTGRGPRN
jgi:Zn-dependent protease